MDQTHHGRYDFSFDPISVVFGSTYTFWLFDNNCDGEPDVLDRCPVPVTGEFNDPSIEVTTTDAYRGGYHIDSEGNVLPDDIRFRATFLTPEPSSLLLLATGLLGLGWLARKRKHPKPSQG